MYSNPKLPNWRLGLAGSSLVWLGLAGSGWVWLGLAGSGARSRARSGARLSLVTRNDLHICKVHNP